MKKHGVIWLAFLTLLVVILAACAPKAAPTPVPATPAPTPVAMAPITASATPAPALATPTPTRPVATPAPTTPAPTPAVKMPAVISVATAGVGTTSYIVASAFAEIIGKYIGTKVSVEPSGAAVRWVPLMKTKEIDLSVHCAMSDIREAYYGAYYWKDKGPQPVLHVAAGHVMPWGVLVTDPGIKKIADLKGKKIFGDMKGLRHMKGAVDIFIREAGLKPGDVEVLTYADVNEATKGVQEGKAIGVCYATTVLPIVELDRSKPLYGVPVPKEMADKVREEFPEFGFMTWKKGDGIGKEDIPFLSTPCGIAAQADLDPEVVYTLLKTVYSRYDEYKDKHIIMKQWTPEQAVSAFASPVHPGAIKYFKEKGLWGVEQEKLNQKLLAQPRG